MKLSKKIKNWLYPGPVLIFLGLLILAVYFYPLLLLETRFFVKNIFFKEPKIETEAQVKLPFTPVDPNFSVIIPKIDINAKIIPNIDPYNREEYQKALSTGVAHAKGTAYPNEDGQIFIFAHSTDSSINVNRYNAIFYLLDKLEIGEKIYIIYKEKTYGYQIKEKKVVDPSEIQYLERKDQGNTLILMTCWPAGTSLKRLLVISQKILP